MLRGPSLSLILVLYLRQVKGRKKGGKKGGGGRLRTWASLEKQQLINLKYIDAHRLIPSSKKNRRGKEKKKEKKEEGGGEKGIHTRKDGGLNGALPSLTYTLNLRE